MSTSEHPKADREGVLVHAVLISKKRIGDANALAAYLGLAFPEHSEVVSAHEISFRDVNLEKIHELTYEEWFSREHKEMLMRGIHGLEKGVHILPLKEEIEEKKELSIRERRGVALDLLLQGMMSDLIERMIPGVSTSTSFIRKWSVIDGPQVKEGLFGKPRSSKILVIGVCSV